MKKKLLLACVSIFLNLLVLSLIRGYLGLDVACIIAIIAYMLFTYYVFITLKTSKFHVKLIIVLIGTIIVHVPQRIIDFKSQLISLPEFMCEILGVILGLLFIYVGKVGKLIILLITFLSSLIVYIKHDSVIDSLIYSNLFNKNTKQIKIDAVPYFDSNNVNINDKLFNPADLIVLNIWATSCGACIAEFPQIDSLYNLSLQSSKIKLYTACILQNGDRKTPYEIGSMKYTKFPIFTIPNWDYVINEYGMDGVPVTFVIKNNEVLFRGTLLNAWGFAIEQY